MDKTPTSLVDIYVTHLLNQERPDEVNRSRTCRRQCDVLNKTQRTLSYAKRFSAKIVKRRICTLLQTWRDFIDANKLHDINFKFFHNSKLTRWYKIDFLMYLRSKPSWIYPHIPYEWNNFHCVTEFCCITHHLLYYPSLTVIPITYCITHHLLYYPSLTVLPITYCNTHHLLYYPSLTVLPITQVLWYW